VRNVNFDWVEPARVMRIQIDQDQARQLGLSSQDVALALNGVVTGATITQVRDSIYLVNVVGRATGPERASIDTLRDLQIGLRDGPRRRARSRRRRRAVAATTAASTESEGCQCSQSPAPAQV